VVRGAESAAARFTVPYSFAMPERTYTEEEVAALFERAAKLQAGTSKPRDRAGLTLEELEHIAAETGLDPVLLRRAALELDEPDWSEDGRSGSPGTHLYAERWIDGTVTPGLEEIVTAELRRRFDHRARLSQSGSSPGSDDPTTEWEHTSRSGVHTRVAVLPHDDLVRVRITQRVGWGSTAVEAGTYSGLIGLLVGLFALVATSVAIGAVVALVTLLAVAPLIYGLDSRWRQRKQRDIEDLADWVAARMQARPARSGTSRIIEGATPDAPESEEDRVTRNRNRIRS
jgi:hypothetical protein